MDIVNKFKDLDVAEGIKEQSENPLTLPMPGQSQNILNSKIMASTLAELIGQKKFVGTNEIGVTATPAFHIRTFAFSYDYVMSHIGTLPTNIAPNFYKGFRADLKITMEVTSMMQQQGALIVNVVNMPSTLYNYSLRNMVNLPNLTKLPRSFVTYGHSGTYTYTLPWQSNLEFWPFKNNTGEIYYSDPTSDSSELINNGYMDNGRIIVRVFNPLRIVENVTPTVALRFWAQLDNLRFSAYQPDNYQ